MLLLVEAPVTSPIDCAVTTIASLNEPTVTFDSLRKAVVLGSVLASYNVEAFSLERLRTLTKADIDERYQTFKRMSQFEVLA